MQPEVIFTVDMGWTNTRPVRPEQHTSRLRLPAQSETDALQFAADWVMARPGTWLHRQAEMPTSFKIVHIGDEEV